MLPLRVLLTKKCNSNCIFCIEKTKNVVIDRMSDLMFARKINKMIDMKMVSGVSLLGGEPLIFPNIVRLINNLKMHPFVTTNGTKFVKDPIFREVLMQSKMRAMNLSFHHYEEKKREELGSKLFTNEEMMKAIGSLSKENKDKITVNTLMMKDYCGTMEDMNKMIDFVGHIGLRQIKFMKFLMPKNLTDETSKFIMKHKPDEIKEIEDNSNYYKEDGRILWKIRNGVTVYLHPSYNMYNNCRIMFSDGVVKCLTYIQKTEKCNT
jgi:molybdenum cofactor biosynthesis enzyme MoaA